MGEDNKAMQENGTAELTAEKAEGTPLPEFDSDNAAEPKEAEASPVDEKKTEVTASKEQKKGETKTETDKSESDDRIAALEGKLAARDAGVPKEHTDDVLTLAHAEMKKNGGTLEAAIEAVLKRHPSMKGTAPANITTGAKTKNDAANDTDDAKIKKIMGIK